jgi:hypothetical protein
MDFLEQSLNPLRKRATMKNSIEISVPKPCHEDWSKMTPREKGKFCSTCMKTVVDFRKKSTEEIQEYFSNHHGKNICGHFQKEQLDRITLEIPDTVILQNISFQKLFLLALLFVMGTSLLSCKGSGDKKQKIEDIILIDTISKPEVDPITCKNFTDSTPRYNFTEGVSPSKTPNTLVTTDIVVMKSDLKSIEQVELAKKTDQQYYIFGQTSVYPSEKPVKRFMNKDVKGHPKVSIDSIVEIEEEEEIVEDVLGFTEVQKVNIESNVEEEWKYVIGYVVKQYPKFPESQPLNGIRADEDFNKRMQRFFKNNFKIPQQDLGLKNDRHRIITEFEIDSLGNLNHITIKAPHPAIKIEVQRVLKQLPVFIPAEQRGKPIKTKYTLPIFIDLKKQ